MIALLTDFGNGEYQGIVKGVIRRESDTEIIDLNHSIKVGCVLQGAWVLFHSYRFFPKKTIFLAIVDPSVGTSRNAIAIKTNNYTFIGPDNGLLFPSAIEDGIIETRRIPVIKSSKTFEGRDVFAPACALIQNIGIPSSWEKIEKLKPISFPQIKRDGIVTNIDSFGNIITNLPHIGKTEYVVKWKKLSKKMKFYDTYESAMDIFLIVGSCNTLEISIKAGCAIKKLKVKIGDKISVV